MHRIYRGAACNLSATEFDSGEDGLINTRRLHNPLPPIVQPVWSAFLSSNENIDDNGETMEQRMHGIGSHPQYYLMEDDPFKRVSEGPLFSRAWVLQEQILVIRRMSMFSRTLLTRSGF